MRNKKRESTCGMYLSARVGHCLLKAISLRHSVGVLLANTAMSLSATDCSACFSWLRLLSMLLNSLPLVVVCPDCLSEACWPSLALSPPLPAVSLADAAGSAGERGAACCTAGCTKPLSSADLRPLPKCQDFCILERETVSRRR